MSSYAYMFHLATEEMTGRMIAAEKRVKELEAENAELLEDAERYRWLRKQCSVTGSLTIAKAGMWDLTPWSGDDPDRHIDAARQQADDEGEA